MQMKAVLFRQPNVPVNVENIEIDEPLANEVLIRTVASGVCHSDLHMVAGNMRMGPQPVVLGHEGAGVVEAVGEDVTVVKAGDHVVGCLSGFCGTCTQCLTGHPNLCTGGYVARKPGQAPRVSLDGVGLGQFGGVGSYAERMLLHENSVVRIDEDIPLTAASLIGCGVLTGVGAALRTAHVEAADRRRVRLRRRGPLRRAGRPHRGRFEDHRSRHVRLEAGDGDAGGCYGRGELRIIRPRDCGARADRRRRRRPGAGVRGQRDPDPPGRGVPRNPGHADHRGRAPAGSVLEIPFMAIRPECKVQTSRMGSNRFRIDIPRYLDLYRQRKLLLDEMVSRTGPLEDINNAFRAMKEGEVARTVLTFN